ncbi:MAG: DUF488 family protein, partial [Petrimonas sp.]|nr:DUF488 family protein [Petrimonas sp.]
FEFYEENTLKQNQEYLLKVSELIDSEKRIALTCFEHNPKECHRARVAKHLMLLPDIKYELKHLM